MDCGNGSFANLSQQIDPGLLDAVFISHAHHDHVADLASMFHFLTYVPHAFRHKIKLIASAETFASLETMFGLNLQDIFDFSEVNNKSLMSIVGSRSTFFETLHIPGSLAIRLVEEDGKSLVYTGDASPASDIAAFAKSCDLLIGECTWLHRPARLPSGLHFDAFELGELAKRSEVASVMVTHVAYPNSPDDASSIVKTHFGGKVITAVDLLSIQF